MRKNDIDLNNPEDSLALLLDEKTPQNLIDDVIEMDEFASNIYNKTLHVLKNKKEYLSYIRAEKAELDRKAEIKYAKEEGIKEGMKEGELIKSEKIAINFKKDGIPIEIIAKNTGLAIEFIEKL